MNRSTSKLALHFLVLMGCAFLLYFLSVGLAAPAADALKYMNDGSKSKTFGEWALFWGLAFVCTAAWSLLWVGFKHAEKHCVELMFRKKEVE